MSALRAGCGGFSGVLELNWFRSGVSNDLPEECCLLMDDRRILLDFNGDDEAPAESMCVDCVLWK